MNKRLPLENAENPVLKAIKEHDQKLLRIELAKREARRRYEEQLDEDILEAEYEEYCADKDWGPMTTRVIRGIRGNGSYIFE